MKTGILATARQRVGFFRAGFRVTLRVPGLGENPDINYYFWLHTLAGGLCEDLFVPIFSQNLWPKVFTKTTREHKSWVSLEHFEKN